MTADWICETFGCLHLSDEQITNQAKLPEDQQLCITDACRIIYPGKNHDAWWDLAQLKDQLKDAVDIFEFLHADAVGVCKGNLTVLRR
jgi:hypothetical protein